MEHTQLQVTKNTRNQLQAMKITKRESYDEIIKRLIQIAKEKKREKFIIEP